MDQLVQQLKDGTMELLEVPFPKLGPQQVLVRNHYSLISIGTESKTVKDARAGYIAKARSRQEEVKKVIKAAKTFGIKETYDMVMKKLEAPSALGYSTAGEIIGLGHEVTGLKVGDRVSCGGGSAVHAEVVAVPQKLVAKVGKDTSMEHAAFTTVGAIAMQGVRQADLRIGESCAIIGMGLLGLLTAQILQASGVHVIGIDLDAKKIALAKSLGFKDSYLRHDVDLLDRVKSLSHGHGLDATIITAGTSSTDPVDLAGEMARHKGTVVVVGNVATGFKRKSYYRKELNLVMSCSYGPGRYDTEYEERGLDYPIGHVRWTENRNMLSFLELVDSGRIDLAPLVSKVIDFGEAPSAYDMIMADASDLTGVLLRYDLDKEMKRSVAIKEPAAGPISQPTVGWIGAGNFAGNFLLPNVADKARLHSVANNRPNSGRSAADRFGFAKVVSEESEIIGDAAVDTVFITGRHETHGPLAAAALNAGKTVFVEKPLCLDRAQLADIIEAQQAENGRLMVGFNRRFAPMVLSAKKFVGSGPLSMSYRINAGVLPKDHWVNHAQIGGGRIIGELVHFIDLCGFVCDAALESLSASALDDPSGLQNTVTVDLRFVDGSIASIAYMSNGSNSLSKERLEIYGKGRAVVIDDFKKMELHSDKTEVSKAKQDKGHGHEVAAFFEALTQGSPLPITFEECVRSTEASFMVLDSLKGNGARQYA